jgi:hypothetical protein
MPLTLDTLFLFGGSFSCLDGLKSSLDIFFIHSIYRQRKFLLSEMLM